MEELKQMTRYFIFGAEAKKKVFGPCPSNPSWSFLNPNDCPIY
jgi:hypothetical protein